MCLSFNMGWQILVFYTFWLPLMNYFTVWVPVRAQLTCLRKVSDHRLSKPEGFNVSFLNGL